MKVLLVNPRGFCAGVRMAIDVVDQVLDVCAGETIYVYHDIVHNTHVVRAFEERGVRFVEDLAHVPEGKIVVFSAHGVSPAVRAQAAERGLTAIDATCPLVTKVHMEALRYSRQGYQILLIGHRDHQEVIGTHGEAPGAITVVETPEDAWRVEVADPEKLVYLTQTTLSVDDAGAIIGELKRRFPAIKAPPKDDICYATTNRQTAVRQLAPECELVLVIGSRHSSNSNRLVEIAESSGCMACLIDDEADIDPGWFESVNQVLVTAGASAPEDLVAQVCRWITGRFGASIELRSVTEERVEFDLPGTLKKMMRTKGIDPSERRIAVAPPEITAERYGATPLTVGET